jgi:3-hydroxyisobutyrate dehydrogenase-like beta-hydroxyacid dehydrogenase
LIGDVNGEKATIGFIGLGIMGSRMATNVANAGFPLIANTRTQSNGEAWAKEHDAQYERDRAELAARADIVITMVVDGAQVESILLDARFVDAMRPGSNCVDMSTVGPETSTKVSESLAVHDVGFLDAPVTGSSPRAEDGTLAIMAGGEALHFDRVRPVLEAMGKLIVHVGPVGHGSLVKLLNNTIAAANAVTVGEALVLAHSLGIDLDRATDVWGAGSAASAMLALKGDAMRQHDYATLFKLEHMLKDVRLCMRHADRAGIAFPSGEHARERLEDAHRRGFDDEDFAAVIEAIEAAAGVRL